MAKLVLLRTVERHLDKRVPWSTLRLKMRLNRIREEHHLKWSRDSLKSLPKLAAKPTDCLTKTWKQTKTKIVANQSSSRLSKCPFWLTQSIWTSSCSRQVTMVCLSLNLQSQWSLEMMQRITRKKWSKGSHQLRETKKNLLNSKRSERKSQLTHRLKSRKPLWMKSHLRLSKATHLRRMMHSLRLKLKSKLKKRRKSWISSKTPWIRQ